MSLSLFSCLSVLQAACTAQHGHITLYTKLPLPLSHLSPSPLHPLLSFHLHFSPVLTIHPLLTPSFAPYYTIAYHSIPQHTTLSCPAFPVVSLSWSYTPI
ncbi:hypothetical protein BKA81DRAFT_362830 [Phyllosticta paracitricarpa]